MRTTGDDTHPGSTTRTLRRLLLVLLPGALALGTLLTGLQPGSDARAEDTVQWSVRTADNDLGTARPNFSYQVEPGDVVDDALVVANRGSEPVLLDVYAADGFTTASGHLDLLPAGTPSTDLGTWVDPTADRLELEPGEEVEVHFRLRVPDDAAPGDHPGGIVTSLVAEEGAETVRVDRRLGSRIHVRVAGEQQLGLVTSDLAVRPDVPLLPWEPTRVTVAWTTTNTGTVRAFATSAVRVSGPGGLAATGTEEVLSEITPGSAVRHEVVLDDVTPLGLLGATLTLTPEAVGGEVGPAVTAGASAWAVPVVAVAVVLALLVVAVVTGVVRGRRTRDDLRPARAATG